MDITENYIRVRVANPSLFIRFRIKVLGHGIKAVIGFKKGGGSQIQSVLFPKEQYNLAQAKAWIKSHGYSVAETVSLEEAKFEETMLSEALRIEEVTTWFEDKNVPIGGVIGAKKNKMELRSGVPATDGRVFALTNDSKVDKSKQEIVEWFETRYKKPENCGCGCE